jgi:hypothetical protein
MRFSDSSGKIEIFKWKSNIFFHFDREQNHSIKITDHMKWEIHQLQLSLLKLNISSINSFEMFNNEEIENISLDEIGQLLSNLWFNYETKETKYFTAQIDNLEFVYQLMIFSSSWNKCN